MSTDRPTLIQGDARALPLPDESVDVVCTSPPFFGLRDYGTDGQLGAEATPREFIDALVACTREMVRVLKPSGSIFVNLGDKYSGAAGLKSGVRTFTDGHAPGGRWPAVPRGRAVEAPPKSLLMLPERYRIAAVDELGLIARAVLVWSKPNGLPESVTDRVRRSHEDWVHLTKSPRYYSAVDEIREPHQGQQGGTRSTAYGAGHTTTTRVRNGEGATSLRSTDTNALGRLPGSVWTVASQPLNVPADLGVDHYAAQPMHWPRQLIRGWCPPAGTVLDPFSGTGTTALVAAMLGRRGIGVDLSAGYQRIARWRCNDPKERARAAGLDPDQVAKVTVPAAGQFDLFEVTA